MIGSGIRDISKSDSLTNGSHLASEHRGPGAYLKSFRVGQRIKIENVASYLGVSIAMVKAMEADDFRHPLLAHQDELAEYYSKYAQFFHLDPQEIVNKLQEKCYQPKITSNVRSRLYQFSKLRWLIIACVLCGVIELIIWTYQKPAYVEESWQLSSNEVTLSDTVHEMILEELQAEEMQRI